MGTIRILGIDPSLNSFGIAKTVVDLKTMEVIADEVYVIQPDKADAVTKKIVRKNSDDLRRATWLQSKMIEACEGFDLVAVEMPVGSQSARAMASYGIVIGVLSSCSTPMIEVTATEVKLAGAGSKTATKREMIDWGTRKHPDAGWKTVKRKGNVELVASNEHAADALAAVYAALDTVQFKSITMMFNKINKVA